MILAISESDCRRFELNIHDDLMIIRFEDTNTKKANENWSEC